MKMLKILAVLLFTACIPPALAQDSITIPPPQTPENPPVKTPEAAKIQEMRVYEAINMENLSKMYWRIKKLDIENDKHVDNFIAINQCQVYRDYVSNEFQWGEIRESAVKLLEEGKKSFPLRLKTMQPLRFGEYDFKKEGFDIWERYDVNGMRRLEVLVPEFDEEICGFSYSAVIEGYPRGIVIEFSQPLSLDYVPVRPDKAERYIKEKLENYQNRAYYRQTEKALFKTRDAYLVLKFKAFAYKGDTSTRDGYLLANVLSVLEALEVYADPELTDLLYERKFRQSHKVSAKESKMIEEYQARKKKHLEDIKTKKEKRQPQQAPVN